MLPASLAEQRRWVTPAPLNVAPQLVGLPLARPLRRGLAMALDLLLVALCSGVDAPWLAGGLVLVVLQLRSQRGNRSRRRLAVGWLGVLVLALLALLALNDGAGRWAEPGSGARERMAAQQQALDDDDDRPAADTTTTTVSVATAAAVPASHAVDAARIAALQAQVARLQKTAQPVGWRAELRRQLHNLGASFGWGVVYFSLLPAWWGGQTVGKKLLGLRVVELTGKPMTVMRNLKRYGGYAAGMATGGLGFAQVLWDANRQGIQDKAAHTVVIDLRAPAAQAGGATADIAS